MCVENRVPRLLSRRDEAISTALMAVSLAIGCYGAVHGVDDSVFVVADLIIANMAARRVLAARRNGTPTRGRFLVGQATIAGLLAFCALALIALNLAAHPIVLWAALPAVVALLFLTRRMGPMFPLSGHAQRG